MTRRGFWIALVAGAVALAAALVPWDLGGSLLRERVATQIEAATGLATTARGRLAITLLPRPRIKIEDVSFRSADGSLDATAAVLKGDLRIGPILAGRLELATATLFQPVIHADLDGHPFGADAVLRRRNTAAARLRPWVVSLVAGKVFVRGADIGGETGFDDVNLRLDWRSPSRPATLAGRATLSGAAAEFSAWTGDPAGLASGLPAPLTLRLSSAPLDLDIDGKANAGQAGRFEGRAAVVSRAPAELRRIFGLAFPIPEGVDGARLTAEISADADRLQLGNLHVALGANAFEGNLSVVRTEGRPAISATLATNAFVLDPLLPFLPSIRAADGGWSREPLPRTGDWPDLDLRLSAASVRARDVRFEDVGLSVILRDGRADLSLAEARAYGGAFKARASTLAVAQGLTTKFSGNFEHIDAAAALAAGWRIDNLAGRMDGDLTFEGTGDSPYEIARILSGRASLRMSDGAIAGMDFEQALRRIDKRPGAGAADARTGRTPFSKATAGFDIAQGVATLREAQFDGAGVALSFSGEVGIAGRAFNLQGLARQTVADAGARSDVPVLRMSIGGSWDDIMLQVDADTNARRPDLPAVQPAQAR